MSDERLDAIRARAAAATPGPWRWYGIRSNQDIRLMSGAVAWRSEVMGFQRWGTQHAEPVFRNPEPGGKWFIPTRDICKFEVCPDCIDPKDPRVYRDNVIALRHPDAEFIAAARADVDYLLSVIDKMTTDGQ